MLVSFGYSKPFAVSWYAVDYDGRAYNYRELYGCAGKPDVGIRWTAQKIADKILELEAVIAKGKEQRKALLNRDKAIKFQLQNFKYKVLDLEKKLIDSQFKLAVEKREKNPLLR